MAALRQRSVVNCDGLHTVEQRILRGPLGTVDDARVCAAIGCALGC